MARDGGLGAAGGFPSTLGVCPEEFLGDDRQVIETLQLLRSQCPGKTATYDWIRDQLIALWGASWTLVQINQTMSALFVRQYLKRVPGVGVRFSTSRV